VLIVSYSVYMHIAEVEPARCQQVPPTVMFHTANAWEEGDEVRLYGCCMNVVSAH
jgi:carotenoid cleavage dioxygenase-like enzyme